VVALAEARIGAELVAARERDELAGEGRPKKTVGGADSFPARLSDIGLPRDRAARATRLASVPPERSGAGRAVAGRAASARGAGGGGVAVGWRSGRKPGATWRLGLPLHPDFASACYLIAT
jgi:hypothetical protein